MSETHMIDDLAERFATAILGANMSGLEAILSPDFTIWYNFSDATLSREQALAFFGKYFATVSVRFRDIRRLLTPQGWVQQHRVNADGPDGFQIRSEEHTSDLQSLMRISYAVFCLKKKKHQ